MRRAWIRALGVPVVALGLVAVAPAAAAGGAGEGDEAGAGGGPAQEGRVLMISLPGLTWEGVAEHELPAIESFFSGAALGNHATRGVYAQSSPGGAYLTISAGSRAAGGGSTDGQQLALDDRSAGSSAGEIFERRTGEPPDGDYVALDWPSVLRENADHPYETELGLLTETLQDAGMATSAIGNADGTDTMAGAHERQVGLAVVTDQGVVPEGHLGAELTVTDVGRPFGVRMDHDRVVERFRETWRGLEDQGGLAVVEASDLARTMRYRDRVDSGRYDELWGEAVTAADGLVGRLLEEVDPARDSVVLLAPYNLPGDRDLTVAAMRTAGAPSERSGDAGYLRSASTQRSGYVTLVDVAPTILDQLDVERPASMEGRPFEITRDDASVTDRVDHLEAGNDASRFREQLLVPTTLVIVVLLGLVTALAMACLAASPRRWVRRVVQGLGLFTLALMPLSYLARAFPLEDLGLGFYWFFVLATAAAVAALAVAVAGLLRRPRLALVSVLCLAVGVLALDVMTGSHLSLSAAFGYSPTGNSRLYGISNYGLGMFGAAASVLAALVASRSPALPNRLAAVGVMVAALVVIGVPIWGANVGGILSFSPVVVLFASLVLGSRLNVRTLLIGFVVVTAAAVSVFAALDLARPPSERAHLGRLVERVGDEGLAPLFSIMERKGVAAFEVSLRSFWTAAVVVAIVLFLYLRRHPDRPLDRVRDRLPALGAGLASAVAAAVFGSIMNDSGTIVGGTAMLVLVVTLLSLVLEPAPDPARRADAGAGPAAPPADPVSEGGRPEVVAPR